MRKNSIQKDIKNAGFTIIETLVAITILMIAIAGPLTVAEKGLSASIYARDQLIGSYLAQDGMEYIKNVLDTDQLNSSNPVTITNPSDWWLVYQQGTDLAAMCGPNTPCTVDTIGGGVSACGSSCPLYLTTCGYVQSSTVSGCTANSSSDTKNFTRTFYVQPFSINGGSNNAANVVVSVTWPGDVTGGGGVSLEDTVFNTPLR